jgi:2-hydroxy-6-oxonona-2,4-dienedioate hydrolase
MLPVARLLAPDYWVFAPDLPGFGKSERRRHVLTVSELADALAGWMDACGLPTAVFLGQSMGCQVIADFALRHPQRMIATILIGPSMDRFARSVLGQAWRLCIDGTRTPVSSLPIMVRDFMDCGPRRTLTTLRYALADRIEEKLPKLMAPTLVLRGQHDPVASQRWVEELASLLPCGRLGVIPQASHAAQYAAPAETARIVRAFLTEVQSSCRTPAL